MKRTRIKICGVTDTKSAWSAVDAGADAIGLVFVDGSPRQVDVEHAREIVAMLPAFVEPIGLFVNDSPDRIRDISHELGLHTVQLHGQETPEQVAALSPLRVIKAFAFEPREVSSALSPWRGGCDNLAAIRTLSPYAVDVSSGVEAERGVKDATLITSFCQEVQQEDIRRAQVTSR